MAEWTRWFGDTHRISERFPYIQSIVCYHPAQFHSCYDSRLILGIIAHCHQKPLSPIDKCSVSGVYYDHTMQRSCYLGRVGVVEADYAKGQLHSTRAPGDSV